MLQLESQVTHVSADVELPPAQVKPSSMVVQSELQPSPVSLLPSSHTSEPTRKPSAQIATQVSLLPIEPPEHLKPGSMAQLALHPSPLIVLLSSQASAVSQSTRTPSPHLGAHTSRPPTPEPNALVDVHSNPVSTRHRVSQPSPPTVLLSSQISAVVRTPSPQMCTGLT